MTPKSSIQPASEPELAGWIVDKSGARKAGMWKKDILEWVGKVEVEAMGFCGEWRDVERNEIEVRKRDRFVHTSWGDLVRPRGYVVMFHFLSRAFCG
jgi:hypothetical protein